MTSTDAPPPALGYSRVIAYAFVDESVTWTGRQILYVDGVLLGAVPRLAICQNIFGELKDFLLCHCNEQWEELGLTGSPSLEQLKAQTERSYRGITSKWIHTEMPAESVEQWIRAQAAETTCSFCGKLPPEVQDMVLGNKACICNECVAAIHQAMCESASGKAGASPS